MNAIWKCAKAWRRSGLAAAVAVASVAFVGAASAAPPMPRFSPPTADPVGVDPNGVAVARDGANTLLVSANAGANTVTALVLDHDGSVVSQTDYAVGRSPRSVAIGDLNGDGLLDLAVANYGDPDPLFGRGSISVLYGTGTGAFGLATDIPLSSHAWSIAIGDVDADQHPDIAVGTRYPDTVSVLWGPTFQDTAKVADGASSVAIGDLDGNGTADVAAADLNADVVWTAVANSSRQFTTNAFPLQAHGGARSVAIGDLNGDGNVDLAVANEFTDTVSVLFGNGNATFNSHVEYSVGNAPWSVAIGDLNLDGHPDIATANPASADVSVLVNSGTGTFGQPPSSFHIGGFPSAIALHDLNGDGALDVAVAEVIADQINVLTNLGNTPAGSGIVVTPADPRTGTTPLTITFNQVTEGNTTLTTSSAGPSPPTGFDVQGVYYELATTATFDSAEVCFPYTSPPAPPTPAIMHWVGGVPVIEPTSRDTGTEVCANVTSFSPFALVVPSAPADTQPPVITCGAADGAWHAANVSIPCTARDDGSGLSDPADAAFSLTTSVPDGVEDANASTGSRSVCDLVGNCATAGPVAGNKIDRKAPALTLPANQTVDATSAAGATVRFIASATDGADPNPSIGCSPPSGSVFAIGASTVDCTATDHVGNASHGSFTVTVLGAKEQLGRLIEQVVNASRLPPALKAQLITSLQALLARFDPTKPAQRQAVCTALTRFANALGRLAGHGISPAQAAEWTADANRIRAVLGCAAITHRARQTYRPIHHKHRRGAHANHPTHV